MPTPRTPLRPPPGQTSLAARLAAPDQADQVGGTQRGHISLAILSAFALVIALISLWLNLRELCPA